MSGEDEQKFDELIARIFAAIDAGQVVDPEEWIGRHPEFAVPLKKFFDDLVVGDWLKQQFGPTGALDSTATASSARHLTRIEVPSTHSAPDQGQDRESDLGPFGRYLL